MNSSTQACLHRAHFTFSESAPGTRGLLGPIQFITIISLFVGAHGVFLGLEHARKVLNLWVKPESCFLWFSFVFFC